MCACLITTVQSLYFAALVKHVGKAADVKAAVTACVDVAALKTIAGAADAERARLHVDVVAAWTRVKALRQWLRGKKTSFPQ